MIIHDELARCSSCDRPIMWKRHKTSGKWAPIDLQPVPSGNLLLVPDDPDFYRHAQPWDEPGDRYTNHFQTCPHAQTWRSYSRRTASK